MNDYVAFLGRDDAEVRKLERGDRSERRRERLIDCLAAVSPPQVASNGTQGAEHLRPIEALALAMFTEISHSFLSVGGRAFR